MVDQQPTLPSTPDNCSTRISNFYDNSKILITGGTGFVGKALVEKLLRSCDGVDSLYLLMRPKKGRNVEERLEDLLQNPVFNIVKDTNPNALKKVKAITGDVSLSNLGLSNKDTEFIIQHINIVFHSAATVKFNEELKRAVVHNTLGTDRLLQLCKKMKHLKSFVHVSTAFSNCDNIDIKEDVYKPIYDPNAILKCIDILPEETVKVFTKRLLGKHPNTYTLTKAMAEYIISENASVIPSTIVRPSIIIGAWKEPFPGWVDNISGITGICMECGRGTIRTILAEEKCVMELIPIDTVVNTLITAAWYSTKNRTNSVRVINCTTGKLKPIKWEQFRQILTRHSLEYPSKYVTWYPNFSYRNNRFLHKLYSLLFHLIPSALLDVYLILLGKRPMMLKISQKFHTALLNGSFFSCNQWNIDVAEMNKLAKAVEHSDDGDQFQLNLKDSEFDWSDQIKNFLLGIRQYVLKDDLSSLPNARKKLKRFYEKPLQHNFIQLVVPTVSGSLQKVEVISFSYMKLEGMLVCCLDLMRCSNYTIASIELPKIELYWFRQGLLLILAFAVFMTLYFLRNFC